MDHLCQQLSSQCAIRTWARTGVGGRERGRGGGGAGESPPRTPRESLPPTPRHHPDPKPFQTPPTPPFPDAGVSSPSGTARLRHVLRGPLASTRQGAGSAVQDGLIFLRAAARRGFEGGPHHTVRHEAPPHLPQPLHRVRARQKHEEGQAQADGLQPVRRDGLEL